MTALLRSAVALACGLLFGFGLAVSGMLDPGRVRSFLDLFGRWDPSLAFVLAGAVVTAFAGVRLTRRRTAPVLAARYDWPTGRRIDARLVVGAAIFGVGWGLSGLCPGPALADLTLGAAPFLVFVAAMVAGLALVRLGDDGLRPRATEEGVEAELEARPGPQRPEPTGLVQYAHRRRP